MSIEDMKKAYESNLAGSVTTYFARCRKDVLILIALIEAADELLVDEPDNYDMQVTANRWK